MMYPLTYDAFYIHLKDGGISLSLPCYRVDIFLLECFLHMPSNIFAISPSFSVGIVYISNGMLSRHHDLSNLINLHQ